MGLVQRALRAHIKLPVTASRATWATSWTREIAGPTCAHASTERRPPGPLAPETELNIASHARMDICCDGAANFPSRQHVHGCVNLLAEIECTPKNLGFPNMHLNHIETNQPWS